MTADWLLVVAGGAVGAALRYLMSVVAKQRAHSSFHWGTFAANVTAAFVLGFVAAAAGEDVVTQREQLLLATGFCGALSTWSTFSYELLTQVSARQAAAAAVYLTATVAVGLGLSFAGAALARGIW